MGPVFRFGDRGRRRFAASTTDYINDRRTRRKRRLTSKDCLLIRSPSFAAGSLTDASLVTDIAQEFKSTNFKDENGGVEEESGDYFPNCKKDLSNNDGASIGKMRPSRYPQQSRKNLHTRRGYSAQTSSKCLNNSETHSIQSSDPTSDSKGLSKSLKKFPDTVTRGMKSALFQKSEIESRQAIFSKLKHNSKSSTSNRAYSAQSENRKWMMQELLPRHCRQADNCETSSDDINISYTYSRPRLRHGKSELLERCDNSSAVGSEQSTDISFTLQRPSFVFHHPTATYLLTEIPKKNSEDSPERESTSSSAEVLNRWKNNYPFRVSSTRHIPKEKLSLALEEPFRETKQSFDICAAKYHMNRSWEEDIQAMYATVNHITPPSRGRRPRRSSIHRWRTCSPQREPTDPGIMCTEKTKPRTAHVQFTDQASGYNLEDRGTSPLPQPSVVHRGVGYTIENRGTSPFPLKPSVDKEVSVEEPQETWKDSETKHIESTMKTIARLKEIHPPLNICVKGTIQKGHQKGAKRKRSTSVYPGSPPPTSLRDKGIVVFSDVERSQTINSTNICPLELDDGWSSHSIVISGFMKENNESPTNDLPSKQFWPSPYPFEVLGTSYTVDNPILSSPVKETAQFEGSNYALPVEDELYAQNSDTWPSLNSYVVEPDSDTPSTSNLTPSNINEDDRCVIQEISSVPNSEKYTVHDNLETVYDNLDSSDKKMVIRTTWQLQQQKNASPDKVENLPKYVPSPLSVAQPNTGNCRSFPKMRKEYRLLYRTHPLQPFLRRRLHVPGCPGACGGTKKIGGCILLRAKKLSG